MKQQTTSAIILHRINFGEADKILTVLTPENGKLKLIAKGVRKVKSKLAGSVELFSVSNIMYIKGANDIGILTSAKLQTFFGNIAQDYSRTVIGYELLKVANKSTKDAVEFDHYNLLLHSLVALNNTGVNPILVECWFMARQLKLLGHEVNTLTDIDNQKLTEKQKYNYDFKEMGFCNSNNGIYDSRQIKLLRLLTKEEVVKLNLISDLNKVLNLVEQLLKDVLRIYRVN